MRVPDWYPRVPVPEVGHGTLTPVFEKKERGLRKTCHVPSGRYTGPNRDGAHPACPVRVGGPTDQRDDLEVRCGSEQRSRCDRYGPVRSLGGVDPGGPHGKGPQGNKGIGNTSTVPDMYYQYLLTKWSVSVSPLLRRLYLPRWGVGSEPSVVTLSPSAHEYRPYSPTPAYGYPAHTSLDHVSSPFPTAPCVS